MRFAFRIIDLPWSTYLASIWPALTATAFMAMAVLGAKLAAPDEWHRAARLGIEIAVGIGAYCGVVFSVHRARLATFRTMLRSARKR